MAGFRADDLTPLLIPPPQPGLGLRQGVVLTWNQATAENTIQVAGEVMQNVPILNTNESLLLVPGAVVALLTWNSTWFILGRLTIPGTPEAASALGAIRTITQTVTAGETTTLTTFDNLATYGPELVNVQIGPSGKCLLIISALLKGTAARSYSIATGAAYMGFAVTGATTITPALNDSLSVSIQYDTGGVVGAGANEFQLEANASRILPLTLTPGLHTITAKYRAINVAFEARFANRSLTVIPL